MTTIETSVVIEEAMGDTRVVWTPNGSWGHFAYIVGGVYYRKARPRETPHMHLAVKDGVMMLRRMSKQERQSIDAPVIRPKKRKKKR